MNRNFVIDLYGSRVLIHIYLKLAETSGKRTFTTSSSTTTTTTSTTTTTTTTTAMTPLDDYDDKDDVVGLEEADPDDGKKYIYI